MKSNILKFNIFLLMLFYSNLALAQVEQTKRINKKYKVSQNPTIDILNKYGKIQVIPWQKDSVCFEIKFWAKANNQEKLNKVVNNVKFDFVETGSYIVAKTLINSSKNTILKDLTDAASSLLSANSKVKIDYKVYLPKNCKLRIEHKFGDVYIENFKGSFDLDLAHGDLRANRLDGESDIKLKFSKSRISYLFNANLNVEYGEFEVQEANNLKINSRSSEIDIDKILTLFVNSTRDKYRIKYVKNLSGSGSFTEFQIRELINSMNLSNKYESILVENISSQNFDVNLDVYRSDVELNFAQNLAYQLKINHKEVNLIYPKAKSNFKYDSKDENPILSSGTVNGGSSKAKVFIKASNCQIIIK